MVSGAGGAAESRRQAPAPGCQADRASRPSGTAGRRRDRLADGPADLAIALTDVKIVAADSPTLAPPLYVSGIPADEADVLALMGGGRRSTAGGADR